MKAKGKIAEVFSSIQGEGIYLGEQQLFVRFFGCNLNCKFCDTKINSFTEYEPQELIEELKLYGNKHHSVSFTGGEPLLQKDFLKELLKLSCKESFRNYLETNGTFPQGLEEVIDYVDIIAMDIKLPSSTSMDDLWHKHHKFLEVACRKEVFLKAVICKSTKKEDLTEAIKLIKEINKSLVLVLQPNSYENYKAMRKKIEQFRDLCLKENIATCIIPQMHKAAHFK